MDISVIIPVYRVENYIKKCLTSVISQSYKGTVECIVVDDCGGDKSWDIVEDFVNGYKGNVFFRLIRHPYNMGVSAARNTGIKSAVGKYLFFLDSDDTITDDCLEKLSDPLREYPYDFVFGNHNDISSYPISTPFVMSEGAIFDSKLIKKNFRDGWYILVWNKLINRDFIIRNNLYFEQGLIHEDELWCFQLACVANSMYVIKDKTYNYVWDNPNSITSDRYSYKHFLAYNEVLKREIELLKKYKLTQNVYLYYQIEEAKRWRMKDAVRLLNREEQYKHYCEFRAIHVGIPLFMTFDFHYSVRNVIRDIHYLLPSWLGFRYLTLLNKLSSRAK